MRWLFSGTIFRASFLLALSGALLLALASLVVIATTQMPIDLPVSTLELARALKGEPFTRQGAPLLSSRATQPAIANSAKDPEAQIIARAIARQAGLPVGAVHVSFDGPKGSITQRQFDVARRKYRAQLLESGALYGDDPRFSPLIFGSFQISAQLPSGEWQILSRAPSEPQWQYNVAKGILIALLILIPVTWWFSRQLARPMQALSEVAHRIGRGEKVEAFAEGPHEVRAVAGALNKMQDRIRKNMAERAEMLAAIAHDLRTPLARLVFLAASQSDEVKAKFSEEISEMDRMISSTMDYVRSESIEPVREKIDLRSLLESIVHDFSDMNLPVTMADSVSFVVFADPTMLRRVFENVIGNAVAYGNDARVSLSLESGNAVVSVHDSGPGMEPSALARAFDPFFRGEFSRNQRTGGVGLGLAIAKRGIEVHRGNISLENCATGGLLVIISFPVGIHGSQNSN